MSEGGAPGPKWHESTAFLVTAILIAGPLAIPLIWMNRKLTFLAKTALTILLVALTALLVFFGARLTARLQAQLAELKALGL